MAQRYKGIGNLGGLDPITRANMRKIDRAMKSISSAVSRQSVGDDSAARLSRLWSPRGDSAGGSATSLLYGNYADRPTVEQLQQRGVGALMYVSVDETNGKRVDFFDGSRWTRLLKDGDATSGTGSTETLLKSLTIEAPTDAEAFDIFTTPTAITISAVYSWVRGSASPSIDWNMAHGTNPTSGANLFSATQTTNTTASITTDNSGFNDATMAAGEALWLTTSAKSGTLTMAHWTVLYTED